MTTLVSESEDICYFLLRSSNAYQLLFFVVGTRTPRNRLCSKPTNMRSPTLVAFSRLCATTT